MKAPPASESQPASSLDVNAHKQKESFVDADNDEIEDLSVDPVLEAAEKKESDKKQDGKMLGGPAKKASETADAEEHGEHVAPLGSFLHDAFDFDRSKGNSYTEETTDGQGHHIKKNVTQGPGWKQVEIHSDGPMDVGNIIG